MDFKKFILDNLPAYFFEEDSYKDSEDKGLFERYMGMYGEFLTEETWESINNYLNIIDASICESKYLNHISDSIGNPPDVFQNEQQYRNLLSYIVSVYKIKGTLRAYQLFFGILGFNLEIEEIEPVNAEYLYDAQGIYDTGNELSVYDQTMCAPCSVYNIKFSYADSTQQLTDASILGLLLAAIEFNEPINATLGTLTFTIALRDEAVVEASDNTKVSTQELTLYDIDNQYDDEVDYDLGNFTQGVLSHLKTDKVGSSLRFSLLDILPMGTSYDIDLSYIKVKNNSTQQEVIYNFTEGQTNNGYIELLKQGPGIISMSSNEFKISGRIYLTNNTFFSFNTQADQAQTITPLFFNI